jgi:DNA-binding response OmpR family regulator
MKARLDGMRIALADDDMTFRVIVSEILHSHGCRVFESANGRELWRCIVRGGIDVVVTDVVMPDLHGHDVLRRCRARGRQLPFVIMTSEADRVRGLHAPPSVQLLCKPFTTRDLRDALHRALPPFAAPVEPSPVPCDADEEPTLA